MTASPRHVASRPASPLAWLFAVAWSLAPLAAAAISDPAAGADATPIKVKFDTLGGWKYVEGKTAIPADVKKLDGKAVEVTGFMMPINQTENITTFIIVNTLFGCCFGQAPAVNHVIVVTMEAGKTVDFYPDAVRVIGKFSVGETREQGYLVSIYRLQAVKVVAKRTP